MTKTKLTERYSKVSVIKREDDEGSERRGGRIRCSKVDTRGKGQMEGKNEQERI